jgi:RsiW-degrading membrane proteinase PrsW (M82 family)
MNPLSVSTVVLGWLGFRFDAYELAQSDTFGFLLYSVLVIGVVEETVKFLPFWLVVMRISHFDERVDGLIYACLSCWDSRATRTSTT